MTFEENNPQGTAPEEIAAQETQEQAPGQVEVLPEYTMQDLPAPLRAGFERLGWTDLMPVQARAIPYLLANRDIMIQSRTGSGKTGAYLVPILQRINPEVNETQALVLVPTRELAQQVLREAEALGSEMQIRPVAVYGGTRYGPQLEAFRQGAHLVIGTPGRILDHLLRRSLNLNKLRMMVFDEADRMLSMGFYPDMKRVQSYLPRHPLNTTMFSATFPPQVVGLANEFMHKPAFINLSSDHIHVTEVQHVFYSVPAMDKERAMIRVIEVENPASAIVFCNTKERVHFVAVILQRYGYNAAEISSDLTQSAREAVMEQIRQGQLRFLVATDVASRGIDIPDLSHVFLYEVPEDFESYIHRAGRTGRAGASGVAISLVNSLEKVELRRIAKRFQITFEERPLPTEEEVQAIIEQRTVALLEARLRARDRLKIERMQRFYPFLRQLCGLPEEETEAEEAQGQPAEDLTENTAIAGTAMLLDDFYHEAFHTAQTQQPDGKPAQPRAVPGEGSRSGRRSSRRGRKTGGRTPAEAAAPAEGAAAGKQPKTEHSSSRRRRRGGRSRQTE